jgi:hypothetical protein
MLCTAQASHARPVLALLLDAVVERVFYPYKKYIIYTEYCQTFCLLARHLEISTLNTFSIAVVINLEPFSAR